MSCFSNKSDTCPGTVLLAESGSNITADGEPYIHVRQHMVRLRGDGVLPWISSYIQQSRSPLASPAITIVP